MPCHVTTKASVLRHQGVGLGLWLPKGYQAGGVDSKTNDVYVLSWDVPRKPACNLVETAQPKSRFDTFHPQL